MNNIFTVSKKSLIYYQIIAHIFLVFQLFYGTIEQWIISLFIYLILVTLGGTVGYHRLLSHRSFKCNKFLEYFLTFLGTLGGNGSSITWVAIHREHHKYTDTKQDPHTIEKGFFKVQFLSMLATPDLKFSIDLLRSKFHLFLHKNYWLVNFLYVFILFLIEPIAVIYAYFVPTVLVWHAGSSINTINHLWGYRNYNTSDNSVNNIVSGLLVSGEGWHNNHHKNPSNPKFGKKWWEVDLGYYIIKVIKNG
jgi:fatty-acid desaturase